MIKKSSLAFFIIVLLAQAHLFADGDSLKPEYQKLVQSFVTAVSTNDRKAISKLVKYPLKRKYPIPDISDEKDLLQKFDQIFDKKLSAEIVNSSIANDWSAVGWRGIMLKRGLLWLDYDGTILAVNYQSEAEKRLRIKLIEKEKEGLYPSLQEFERPVLIGETDKFLIRIDGLENSKYRYAAWPKGSQQYSKPDLILQNGEMVFDGNGGNRYFDFKNGEYLYRVYDFVMGSDETPPGSLEIYRSDKLILTQNINNFVTP